MTAKSASKDPDIRGSLPALKRAARRAFELSRATGTPFYVWRDGKVVDLNVRKSKRKRHVR
jgi:hypothetical protein